jgi:hypothetical protein
MATKTTTYEERNFGNSNISVPTGGEPAVTSPKRLARIAGGLYLFVGIFGGFAEGFLDPKIYAAGDAAATARNVLASPELVRIGVFAHLVDATFFVFMALALYQLLKHVNKSVARSMLVLVALAVSIISLNAVFEFEALQVATNSSYAAALGTTGSNAVVQVLMDIQHYGTLIAQIFFGLWLAPMGYLAYKSGWFPRALGIVLVAATVSYLADMLTAFLVPDFGKQIHAFLTIMPIIGEVWLLGYLLVIGVRTVKTAKSDERVLATGATA